MEISDYICPRKSPASADYFHRTPFLIHLGDEAIMAKREKESSARPKPELIGRILRAIISIIVGILPLFEPHRLHLRQS
jgi:hypothetical protein